MSLTSATDTDGSIDLATQLRAKATAALAQAPFDWLVVGQSENIGYLTGYRSVSELLRRDPTMVAALDASGELWLLGPAIDAGPVLYDSVVEPDHFVAYGRFYFESTDGHPASDASDQHDDAKHAGRALLDRLGGGAVLGVDAAARQLLGDVLEGRPTVDATSWMLDLRARKLPGEVARLERAARIVEDAIDGSIELINPGATERDLATFIARSIASAGARPTFIVVTAGDRSALSDAAPTSRTIERGDLVRYDIGCVLDGYWADLGRTVVVGTPTPLQTARYGAIFAGEQAELDAARPGITASSLFQLAVEVVEANGLAPYRRQHCGHAIGTEVYERPVISPAYDDVLEPGMTFCVETPYYEIGWGGMMVEDTIVITESGCRRLNRSDRTLRAV